MTLQIGPTDKVVYMGMSGAGKTTVQQRIAKVFEEDYGIPVIVWDPLGQYPPRVAYRPHELDNRDEFDHLAGTIWQAAPARLEAEEAEQVLPEGPELPRRFKLMAFAGRNIGLSWGVNTRRPQKITKDVLNIADHLIIMKLELRDIGYMRRVLGEAAKQLYIDQDVLDRLRGEPWVPPDLVSDDQVEELWNGEIVLLVTLGDLMRNMPKDPREGGGWIWWYHDGKLRLLPPLDLGKPEQT